MFTLKALAIALSVYLLLMSIPAVVNVRGFQKAIKEIYKSTVLLRLGGLFALLFAFFILNAEYKLEQNWETVMSVIGWLCLVKGVLLLWFPGWMGDLGKKIALKSETLMAVWGLFMLFIAVGIGYLGLFVY